VQCSGTQAAAHADNSPSNFVGFVPLKQSLHIKSGKLRQIIVSRHRGQDTNVFPRDAFALLPKRIDTDGYEPFPSLFPVDDNDISQWACCRCDQNQVCVAANKCNFFPGQLACPLQQKVDSLNLPFAWFATSADDSLGKTGSQASFQRIGNACAWR